MDPQKMMGFASPGDQKVSIPTRDWSAVKLALWRSRVAWEIAARAASEMVERCAHMTGCAGKDDEAEPCLPDCPNRELRMSAQVILSAARQFAPVDARRPADGPYFAPSREYFSAVMAELAAAQAELEALRGSDLTRPEAQPAAKLPGKTAEAKRLRSAAAEFEAGLAELAAAGEEKDETAEEVT